MKRTDLVQLAIIIAGIFIAYAFVAAFPSLLFSVYNWMESGFRGGTYMEHFLGTFILYGFYFVAAAVAISKSKQLAAWLCEKADFKGTVYLPLNKKDLLYTLFIGLGVYGLIQQLPKLLVNLFNKIKSRNSFMTDDSIGNLSASYLITEFITVLLFFVLVYYAGVFADLLAGKINNTEPDDSIPENN